MPSRGSLGRQDKTFHGQETAVLGDDSYCGFCGWLCVLRGKEDAEEGTNGHGRNVPDV